MAAGPWKDGIRPEANGTFTAKYRNAWSRGHRTRGDAKKARAHLILEGNSKPARTTVRDWAERWLTDYARDAETTNRWNRERLSAFLDEFGDRPIAGITIDEAERFARRHPARLPSLKACFNDAANKARLIPDNPFRHVSAPKGEGRKRIVPLTREEIARLADTAVELLEDYGRECFAPMVLTAAWTGMRPAELYALEWRDLDWERQTVHIRREFLSRTGELKNHTKNYLDRIVPLAPPVIEALATVRSASGYRRQEFVFFTRRDHSRFQERSQRHYWHPVRDLFTERLPDSHWLKQRISDGGKPLALYELRHAFASELDRRGVPMKHIAAMLGHQDEGQLARTVYVHRSEEEAREAVRGALWGP